MAVETFEPASPIARPRSADEHELSPERVDAPFPALEPISAWDLPLSVRLWRWLRPDASSKTRRSGTEDARVIRL